MESVVAIRDLRWLILDFAGPTAELPFCLVTGHKIRHWFKPTMTDGWSPSNPLSETDRKSTRGKMNAILFLNGRQECPISFSIALNNHLKLARWYWNLRLKITGVKEGKTMQYLDIRNDSETDDIKWLMRGTGHPLFRGFSSILEGKETLDWQRDEIGYLAYHLGLIPLSSVPEEATNARGCLRMGAYRAAADFIRREGMGDTDIHKMDRSGWTLDQIKYLVAEGLFDVKKVELRPIEDAAWMTHYFISSGASPAGFIRDRKQSIRSKIALLDYINILSDGDVLLLFIEIALAGGGLRIDGHIPTTDEWLGAGEEHQRDIEVVKNGKAMMDIVIPHFLKRRLVSRAREMAKELNEKEKLFLIALLDALEKSGGTDREAIQKLLSALSKASTEH